MKITGAKYLTSVTDKQNILKDGIDFAFVGRSNVGKSSLINTLVNQKKLCKTSSLPGRTRMINYFNINDGAFRFVDLPGYGYAKAGMQNKLLWANIMEDYLLTSGCIKRVFMLIDSRIEPTELDIKMLKFLFFYNIPTTLVATKTDKLPKSKVANYIQRCANRLGVGSGNIIPFSSENGAGRDKLIQIIENTLTDNQSE